MTTDDKPSQPLVWAGAFRGFIKDHGDDPEALADACTKYMQAVFDGYVRDAAIAEGRRLERERCAVYSTLRTRRARSGNSGARLARRKSHRRALTPRMTSPW